MSSGLLVGLVVVPTAAVVVAMFAVLWRERTSPRTAWVAVVSGVVLAAWAVATSVLAYRGFYRPPSTASPPPVGLQLLIAMIVMALALVASPSLRSLLTNQKNLLRLNVWRLEGLVFLALMFTGRMPALWALPSGLGDVLVGAFAFWIAGKLDAPGGRRRAVIFNWLGVADLVVAVGLGVTINAGPAQIFHTTPAGDLVTQFPLALVPGFLVPLAFMVHFVSLWQLSGRRWSEAPRAVTIALAAMLVLVPGASSQQNTRGGSVAGHYADVNGLRMYYETSGRARTDSEPPLVLLHGALSTIETDFGKLRPRLTNRWIIAIEQQGHGHTADVDRPLSYEQMADDTAALLEKLGIRRADFLGFSMGGATVLQVAIRHPSLVRTFVFAGATSFEPGAMYPEIQAGIAALTPEALAGSPYAQAYAQVAPHPADWPKLIAKVKANDVGWTGVPRADLQRIKAPALLLIGDGDIVRPEHVMEMFRLFGGGVPADVRGLPASQLAILPGTTHQGLFDRVDWIASMVTAFFGTPAAKAATH